MAVVYLNGKLVEDKEAVVTCEDRGFNFGDGLYEVIRVYNGTPFCVDKHMARLYSGAAELEIPVPVRADELIENIHRLLEKNQLTEASIYLQVTRGPVPRSHPFPACCQPTVFMKAKEISWRLRDKEKQTRTRTAITHSDIRGGLCHLKTVNILANCLAKTRARKRGADSALLVRQGFVTEAATASAFCVIDGVLYTHPLANILPGITRSNILQLAEVNGWPLREEALPEHTFCSADEVFLGATVLEVAPVVDIDGQPVGDGKPGPVFRRVDEALQGLIQRQCGS